MWYGKSPAPVTIGRCIYCGSTQGILGEEHIIPYSLQGDFVLKEACCKRCEPKINAFETTCTKKIFYNLRLAQKYRSSRKHKTPKPTHLPISLFKNGVWEERLVPTEHYPVLPLRFPYLPSPGMFVGMPPTDKLAIVPYIDVFPKHKEFDKWAKSLVAERVEAFSVPDYFELEAFLKLLAKVAHGATLLYHHIDSFQHLLPKYLLGEDERIFFVVGLSDRPIHESNRLSRPPGFEEPGHAFAIEIYTPDNYEDPRYLGEKGAKYIVARVQLFRYCNAPVYEVVVGKLLGPPDV